MAVVPRRKDRQCLFAVAAAAPATVMKCARGSVYKAHGGLRRYIRWCLASNVFKWPLMTRNLAFCNPN